MHIVKLFMFENKIYFFMKTFYYFNLGDEKVTHSACQNTQFTSKKKKKSNFFIQ